MTNVPGGVIDSLDFVYFSVFNKSRIREQEIKSVETLRSLDGGNSYQTDVSFSLDQLGNLVIFAALLTENKLANLPIPVFSFGTPVNGKAHPDKSIQTYQGLLPYAISDKGALQLYRTWESRIDLENGSASSYIGQGENIDAVIFETPVLFQPSKRLIAFRSPNRSLNLESLAKWEIEENGANQQYSIVYENLEALKQGRNWALNRRYTGIELAENTHLFS